MSPALTTFLFEVANFFVLAAVLAWLFFKPVRAAIESRRAALKKETDDAAAKLAEADRLRTELKQRLADQDRELEQHRTQAINASEQQAKEILTTAREAAGREFDIARQRLVHLEQSQLEFLGRAVAETAGAAISRLLAQLAQPDLEHVLMAAACRELQAFEGNSLAPVRVESARLLHDAERSLLIAALGSAGNSAEFCVVDGLGPGLRITTNRGLVDVSSAGLAKYSENLLASKLAIDDSASGDTVVSAEATNV